MLTRMPDSGPLALVGSGEFLPAMNEIDAEGLPIPRTSSVDGPATTTDRMLGAPASDCR